jgi:hypothetical protein
MIKIDYPEHEFRTRHDKGGHQIFDELRKTWLKLTPEEWVRQHFVRFLISKNIPASLVAIEKQIRVGELNKRFDILVYNADHQPWMMVECKATTVPLNEDVLHQVLRYNIAVPVKYLLITNGTECVVYMKENNKLVELAEVPGFEKKA